MISEDLEARIAEKLHNPTHDPHGDPIPTADLAIDEGTTVSLAELEPGDRGRFVRISDADPAMLRYLDDLGVQIGDRVRVIERQPFDGPVTVRFGQTNHALGVALARAMRIDVS